jgi:hypothetical protein
MEILREEEPAWGKCANVPLRGDRQHQNPRWLSHICDLCQ